MSTSTATTTILTPQYATKRRGGITAVDDASFIAPEAQVTGVIGRNGSGKSTMFNLITGVDTPDSGQILYRGTDITGKSSDTINRMGLGRTFQLTRLFPTMTVM